MAPSSCGYLLEYPLIRVDRFTPTPVKLPRGLREQARGDLPEGSTHFPPARLYLLTHIHTDHLQGLESFANDHAPIYCSPITKAALLRFERTKTRAERDRGEGSIRRPYSHLRITEQQAELMTRESGRRVWARDILHAIPLRTPTIVPYAGCETVRLTLLDSNHMAGGVLFLVEGSRGAVIHAGDMRAEPCKHEAVSEIVALMQLYPPCTRFFLDCWCWGYEELIKAVYRAFRSRVHVDRYKKGMYATWRIEDPHLTSMVTTDCDAASRFHACERTQRCSLIDRDRLEEPRPRPLIVEIAPPSFFMPRHRWAQIRERYSIQVASARHGKAAWPERLVMPFERHSPLVETRHLIRTFAPRNVTPNTGSLQHHFVLAKVCSGDLHRGDASVAQEAAEHALGTPLWRFYCEAWDRSTPAPTPATRKYRAQALAPESDEVQAVADRLSAFHVRARQMFKDASSVLGTGLWGDEDEAAFEGERERMLHRTDDVSQNESILTLKDHQEGESAEDGYEGDVSGIPGSSRVVSDATEVSNTLAVPAAPVALQGNPGAPVSAPPPRPRGIKRRRAHPAPATLDDELASRYLAYLGMFLGWKLYNPHHYSQPRAWRSVRRQKPKLARQAEMSLKAELGIEPPVWNEEELEAAKKAEAESQAQRAGATHGWSADDNVAQDPVPTAQQQAGGEAPQDASRPPMVQQPVAPRSQTPPASQPRRVLAEHPSNRPSPTPPPLRPHYGKLLEALRSGEPCDANRLTLASHIDDDLEQYIRRDGQGETCNGDAPGDQLARVGEAASLLGLASRSKKIAGQLGLVPDSVEFRRLARKLRSALQVAEQQRSAMRAAEAGQSMRPGEGRAVETRNLELLRTLRWSVKALSNDVIGGTDAPTRVTFPTPAQRVSKSSQGMGARTVGILSPPRAELPAARSGASDHAISTTTAMATGTANRTLRFAVSPSPVKRRRVR